MYLLGTFGHENTPEAPSRRPEGNLELKIKDSNLDLTGQSRPCCRLHQSSWWTVTGSQTWPHIHRWGTGAVLDMLAVRTRLRPISLTRSSGTPAALGSPCPLLVTRGICRPRASSLYDWVRLLPPNQMLPADLVDQLGEPGLTVELNQVIVDMVATAKVPLPMGAVACVILDNDERNLVVHASDVSATGGAVGGGHSNTFSLG